MNAGYVVIYLNTEDRGLDAIGISRLHRTRESAEQEVITTARESWDDRFADDEDKPDDRPGTFSDARQYLFEIDEDLEIRELDWWTDEPSV